MKKLYTSFYDHIIRPIITSISPVSYVSRGVAIGLFVGLTPTMGIQMYIAATIWAICRYILRFHFNLPVAVAMVWVTNPVTVVPIYYLFLITGNLVLQLLGVDISPLTYEHFKVAFNEIAQNESSWDAIVEGTKFLLIDLGFPMLTGAVCYAVPCSIAAYFITHQSLTQYRQNKAEEANMSYEEWRVQYESSS